MLNRIFSRTAAATATRRAYACRTFSSGAEPFFYQDLFESPNKPETPYKKLEGSEKWVSTFELDGKKMLKVEPEALTAITTAGMTDIAHLLRPAHLQQLSNILADPEASENDKFVAIELLKNANVAAGMVLPGCQDTGTGIIVGKRGGNVITDGDDEEHLARGVYDTYTERNLRYSQVAPIDMFTEQNTKTNLPAQIELYATKGNEYSFMFMAKGGGSANKTFLYQQTACLCSSRSS